METQLETVFIQYLSEDSKRPERAKLGDLCYDVTAASDPKIVGVCDNNRVGAWRSIDYIEYDVGIAVEVMRPASSNSYCSLLVLPRSSLSKYNLTLANSIGTIDWGYRGSIKLRFKYNFQPSDLRIVESFVSGHANRIKTQEIVGSVDYDKIYAKGDKIGQVHLVNNVDLKWVEVDSVGSSERGSGGFGHTGK